MKKKLVFCLETMALGGVEKELISVLKKIHDKYDVTLLMLYIDDIDILKEIPSDINIRIIGIEKEYYCGGVISLLKKRIKKRKVFEAMSLVIKRCLKLGMATSNTNIDEIATVNDDFDIAICYHIHSPLMLKYVSEKIKAQKKIAWIHNDFYGSGYPIQRLKKYVMEYDEFVAVSRKVETEFRELCHWYNGPISTAYNYLDASEIEERSNECIDDGIFIHEIRIKLLTVGRFTEQKGIDTAIVIASMLKEKKIDFNWFLIGYGELETLYRQLIEKYNVADCFTILGKKTNPYPYIKNCDIYVQPSRHEAYPLVIKEAKILGKPIVCTDFDGADEQIDNGINGIIVPLNDTTALCKELAKLISSSEARGSLSKELKKWQAEDDLQEIIKHFG